MTRRKYPSTGQVLIYVNQEQRALMHCVAFRSDESRVNLDEAPTWLMSAPLELWWGVLSFVGPVKVAPCV